MSHFPNLDGGVKHDGVKLPWHLLPWDAVGAALEKELDPFHAETAETIILSAAHWFQFRSNFAAGIAAQLIAEAGGGDFWTGLEAVVSVLAFGANKYAERNWEKGLAHSRTFAATARHLRAVQKGEMLDAETGLSHYAHAACEMLFALAFTVRGRVDVDDRPLHPDAPAPASGAGE